MIQRRIFVLGTGTGVGKTYVTAGLVSAFRARGARVVGLKPIESGVGPETLASSDAARLAAAGGGEARHCYALPDPLSPHLAARLAGVELSVPRVVEWVGAEESRSGAEVSFVESAGGAFSPVTPGIDNARLGLALGAGLPGPTEFLLVGADALGVLHEVTATLRALSTLQTSGVRPKVRAVVLSEARSRDSSTGTNGRELEGVVFPSLGAMAPDELRVETIARDGNCERFVSLLSEGLRR